MSAYLRDILAALFTVLFVCGTMALSGAALEWLGRLH